MTLRQRKFAGMLAILGFLAVYCLVMMAVGGSLIVGAPMPVELAYFIFAGLGWLPVVMAIIRWMSLAPPRA